MIDCVNACLSVCVFRIQRTKSLKKTNSSCIATNTFNDHRAPHTNEHFNTFFAVILSLAFFVCMLVYLATRFGWYWIEVYFSFHLQSAQAKTTILLKSQLHIYVPLVWFTYKIRFYDFRRMCFKCSALNMVERSLRFSVCITYMHYKHIASERLYFEHLQCLFTVEWQCIFFKRCDASNRSIVRPFSTHTLNSMHTYYVDVSWVIGWMNFFQTWIPFSYKKLHENDSKKAKQSQCVPCIFRTSNVFVWAWRFFSLV